MLITDHPYHRWTVKKQKQLIIWGNVTAVLLLLALLALNILVSPLFFVLIALFFVLAQLVDVATNLHSGKLIRYSYFLLAEPKGKTCHLHTTTLFDCLFLKQKLESTSQPKRWLFANMLEGLQKVSQNLNPNQTQVQTIEGTTYFLNRKSLTRLGFHVEKPSPLQVIILSLNFLNLMIANYVITGKIRWPKVSNTLKFTCSTQEFHEMQPKLKALRSRVLSD